MTYKKNIDPKDKDHEFQRDPIKNHNIVCKRCAAEVIVPKRYTRLCFFCRKNWESKIDFIDKLYCKDWNEEL